MRTRHTDLPFAPILKFWFKSYICNRVCWDGDFGPQRPKLFPPMQLNTNAVFVGRNSHDLPFGLKSSAAEFIQNRIPVG